MSSARLRYFIIAYVSLSVVLIGLIVSVAIGSLRDIEAQIDHEHHVTDQLVDGLNEAKLQTVQIQQYLTDSSATQAADGIADAKTALKLAHEKLDVVARMSPTLMPDVDRLERQIDQLYQTGLKMVTAYGMSRASGNEIMKSPQGFDAQTDRTVDLIEQLSLRITKIQADTVNAEATSLQNSTNLIISLSVVLIAISVMVGAVLYRQVANAFFQRESAIRSLRGLLEGLRTPEESVDSKQQNEVDALTESIVVLMSQREASRQQMEDAKNLAEQANRVKSEFLANLSHEVRTPLNGVLGVAELIEMGELNADQRALLAELKLSGQSLLTMLNRILDFTHIEAGRAEIRHDPFSPAELVAVVASKHRPAALAKGLHLSHRIDEGIPDVVVGDSQRVMQVLDNLISNAINFTQQGSIELAMHKVANAPDQLIWLAFAVADTGVGIDSDQQQQIFEAFSQIDGSATRRVGGTGLGLAICRSLVKAMGGRIELETERGVGSTFTVVLPFAWDE